MSQIDYGLTHLRHDERERQKRHPDQGRRIEHVLAKDASQAVGRPLAAVTGLAAMASRQLALSAPALARRAAKMA